jgi:hypothetical protein
MRMGHGSSQLMRRALLTVSIVAFPFATGAMPALPRAFASERYRTIATIRTLPQPVRRAVDRYIRFNSFGDVGSHIGGGGCIRRDGRRLVLAGLGRRFDFVVYQHGGDSSPTHDHFLVYEHGADPHRTLVFSCRGALPRKLDKLKAAILHGDCSEDTGAIEVD